MKKAFQILFVLAIFSSCGPKPNSSIALIIKETDAYVSQVDANSSLEVELMEGALTDPEGFKDIGKFKYTVYFDSKTKALYKIMNVESTDTTISETYYFRGADLVFINYDVDGTATKMYVQKNKIISETRTDVATQKLLLEKGKRFQKVFQREH